MKDFPCADVHLWQEELEKRVLDEVKRLTEESAENIDESGENKADRGMDEIVEKAKGVREWDNAEKVKKTGKFRITERIIPFFMH